MGFSQRFVTRERYDLTDPGEHFTPNGQRGKSATFEDFPTIPSTPAIPGFYRSSAAIIACATISTACSPDPVPAGPRHRRHHL